MGHNDFELATQLNKTKTKRFLSYFDVMFVKFLRSFIMKLSALEAGFGRSCFRQNLTNFRAFLGLFLALNQIFEFGPVLVGLIYNSALQAFKRDLYDLHSN